MQYPTALGINDSRNIRAALARAAQSLPRIEAVKRVWSCCSVYPQAVARLKRFERDEGIRAEYTVRPNRVVKVFQRHLHPAYLI